MLGGNYQRSVVSLDPWKALPPSVSATEAGGAQGFCTMQIFVKTLTGASMAPAVAPSCSGAQLSSAQRAASVPSAAALTLCCPPFTPLR